MTGDSDMTLQDFIKVYGLPPNVSVNRFCEVACVSSSRFYKLAKDGAIRVRKNGRYTFVPVEDLFKLLRGEQAAA